MANLKALAAVHCVEKLPVDFLPIEKMSVPYSGPSGDFTWQERLTLLLCPGGRIFTVNSLGIFSYLALTSYIGVAYSEWFFLLFPIGPVDLTKYSNTINILSNQVNMQYL